MNDNPPVPANDDGSQPLSPGDRLATLRIIDANFNRATEGLRVVEEYCRFVLDDWQLTAFAKSLRHNILEAIAPLPREQFHAARDTEHDVGTELAGFPSISRWSLDEIVQANLKRVEQALRAMEEYCKLVAPPVAIRLEQLRYRSYTLAKACVTTADSQQRLQGSRLYVLTDVCESEGEFVERVQQLIAGGVHIIQLRDKKLDDRTLLSRARLMRRIIDEPAAGLSRSGGPLCVVNDRPDIAVLARADGVHVGQEELTVHDVRRIVGPEMLVGVSTHNIDQARQAVFDGANYLGCGPTFPSGTKQFDQFPGVAFLRKVAHEIALPAFAIGGITLENLPQVLDAGFTRVAIGGAIAAGNSPRDEAEKFLTVLDGRE